MQPIGMMTEWILLWCEGGSRLWLELRAYRLSLPAVAEAPAENDSEEKDSAKENRNRDSTTPAAGAAATLATPRTKAFRAISPTS